MNTLESFTKKKKNAKKPVTLKICCIWPSVGFLSHKAHKTLKDWLSNGFNTTAETSRPVFVSSSWSHCGQVINWGGRRKWGIRIICRSVSPPKGKKCLDTVSFHGHLCFAVMQCCQLLRLLVSHEDAEKEKSFCSRKHSMLFTSPAQQLDNADTK